MNLKEFLARLTSRKFILALSAALAFWAKRQYTEALGAVIAFLAAEGAADFKRR